MFFGKLRLGRRNRRKSHQCRPYGIESLEVRTLPAGTVNVVVAGNNIVITGDNRTNQIDIVVTPEGLTIIGRTQTNVRYNNVLNVADDIVQLERKISDKTDFTINMNGNDDRVFLSFDGENTLHRLTIDLGGGNDDLLLEQSHGDFCPIKLSGPLALYGGAGDDTLSVNFSEWGDVVLQDRLDVNLGQGNDQLDLHMGQFPGSVEPPGQENDSEDASQTVVTSLVVLGDAVVDGDAGDDRITFHNYGEAAFRSNVTLFGGAGADEVDLHSDGLETRLSVDGNLWIIAGNGSNTYDGADTVSVGDDYLSVNGNLTINTRNGADVVDLEFGGDGDPGMGFVGGMLKIDSGIDNDKVTVYVGVPTEIKGTMQITSGIANDEVTVLTDAVLRVHGNLLVSTGAGQDLARIVAGAGSIEVKGNMDLTLGADSDCAVIGTLAGYFDVFSIESFVPQVQFHVSGNANVNGDEVLSGNGNDQIGICDISIGGDLQVRTGDGRNALSLIGFAVGRDLDVKMGNGNDDALAFGGIVTRNATVETKSGSDRVLVDHVMFGGNALVNLGSRDDKLEIGEVSFSSNTAVVSIDGGVGTDAFDSNTNVLAANVKNFESDHENEIDEVKGNEITNDSIAAIKRCFLSFSFRIGDQFIENE